MQSRQASEPAILLVDDERQTLKYFERAFANDFKVLTAASADEAEALVDADPGAIGLVISDQRMPARSGVSLLNAIRRKHPFIVRMLTTAYSELDDAIEAVNRGEILRYIVKPWNFELLRQEMQTGLLIYSLQTERDLLVAEKLNVRQRMVAVDRARDLAVIAAGLPGLRTAPLAVDDYVRDGAHSLAASRGVVPTAALDMWALPQHEAAHMGSVAREAARVEAQLAAGPSNQGALARAVAAAIAATAAEAAARRVTVTNSVTANEAVAIADEIVASIVGDVLSSLIQGTGEGGSVTIAAQQDAPGALLTMAADAVGDAADPILYGNAATTPARPPGRLFAAYLAARETGGSIRFSREAERLQVEIALPGPGGAGAPPAVRADWLTRLFQHFENWPG